MTRHIAIDASRATVKQATGTETYALRLIQTLIAVNDDRPEPLRFSLFFRDAPAPGLFDQSSNVRSVVIPFPRLWTHIRLAEALWRMRPDISFVPAHSLPLFFPGKSIVTVHDLGYKHFPAAHPPAQRAYLDATTRFSQRRASLVLADSRATADDLQRFYGTRPEKIRVVHPGIDAEDLTATYDQVAAARLKFGLPQRYFLYIGTLQPRKNIKRIVQAFGLWRNEHKDWEAALVLAGGRGWLFDPSWTQETPNVLLTGYVDDSDKPGLLGGATALVFPSLYEGFGFPVLEAMISRVPVIASNSSSLPELVGNAGLTVDPLDVAAIAAAMTRCSQDEALRRELVQRGSRQAKRFTWRASAEKVLDAFDELR